MTEPSVDVTNPPGLTRLRRRATDHDRAMRRMRAVLGARTEPAVRAVAGHGTDDPAVALLDAWAVVSDTVAFYSERIAHEGLLRTAVQPGSVRELARAVGYQPDPGAAAEVDLVFTVDAGPLVPEVVTVPAGTPVRSVPVESTFEGPPGPAALPQTFETATALEARAAWNTLPVSTEERQRLSDGDPIMLRGPVHVRPGDPVLVSAVGADEETPPTLCSVVSAEPDPVHGGWVRLTVTGGPPEQPETVHAFGHRARLFGWNAPDPNLLMVGRGEQLPDVVQSEKEWHWQKYDVDTGSLDLDGEFPDVVDGSWVVVQQADRMVGYQVESAVLTGKAAFALSGRVTQVTTGANIEQEPATGGTFDRRGAMVHGVTVDHDARWAPAALTTLHQVRVPVFTPPFETGRPVLVTWTGAGQPGAASVTVSSCAREGDRCVLTLDGASADPVPTGSVAVHGNVVRASHGETVREVLGSGDGATTFQTFRLRRIPLTFVAVGGGEGRRPELTVRVDDVEWLLTPDLRGAAATDRVYTLRLDEDGTPRIGFGDGTNGARLPTGTDNVVAVYRTGLGAAGAVDAGRITQMPRRPLGIREVTNPAATVGAAAPEQMAQARRNAPRRISTLDRAVSVADHERYAAGYPGIGAARADLVWDGRRNRIVVSVRATGAGAPDGPTLRRLSDALTAVRDPLLPLDVLAATALWFTCLVQVRRDPAWPWRRVRADVLAALEAAYAPWRVPFATPVSSTTVLSIVDKVPGVLSCHVPRLSDRNTENATVLDAASAAWDRAEHHAAPAELLALARAADVTIEEVE
jgi:predicted phage baseplate assembly protein